MPTSNLRPRPIASAPTLEALIAESDAQRQRLVKDRLEAIEHFAHLARESMLGGCDETETGVDEPSRLTYLATLDVIGLLAGAILKDGRKEPRQ